MSNFSPDNKAKKPAILTFRFYILWVVANGIGTATGLVIFFIIAISLGFFGTPFPEQRTSWEIARGMIVGDFKVAIPFGSSIGIMQWLTLRRYVAHSGFWFLTCAIAMFIGITVNDVSRLLFQLPPLPNLFMPWFFFGCISGILQWLILRKQVHNSGFWIPTNIIAGGIAGILLPDLGIIGGSIGYVVIGILTGGILFILLQKTKSTFITQSVT